MNLLQELESKQLKPANEIPKFNVGDTVRVHFRIVEGEKERTQIFEGVVISRKAGESPQARFTVRRVAFNEGVERVFPLHSPRVQKVEVIREGHVRRAKLHYLRKLSGKAARVKGKRRTDVLKKAQTTAPVEIPAEETAPVAEESAQAEESAGAEKK